MVAKCSVLTLRRGAVSGTNAAYGGTVPGTDAAYGGTVSGTDAAYGGTVLYALGDVDKAREMRNTYQTLAKGAGKPAQPA
eukprot:2718085-Rhodomonas_salina.1